MDINNKTRFLPFNAINEFMRDDYRNSVVRQVLTQAESLPDEQRAALERATKKVVTVPGFRNSAKAPAALRVRATTDAFTKSSPLVAVILTAWGELHAPLRQLVYDFLTGRGWTVFPPDADRTLLPGFMITWPKNEDFETLGAAFKEKYPDSEVTSDDLSLMEVWVSMRLPYQTEDEDEPEAEAGALTDEDFPPAAAPAL
jgi:hypothetical protein